MDGFSSHTLKFVNSAEEEYFVKFHFKTDQKIKNFTGEKAMEMDGKDADYSTRDLFDAINRKEFPSWSVYIQLMTPQQAQSYRWNIFDVTKVWPHKDYPLISIGIFLFILRETCIE
jgi:catalase